MLGFFKGKKPQSPSSEAEDLQQPSISPSKLRLWAATGGDSFAPPVPLLDEERNSTVIKGLSVGLRKINAKKIKCN